MQTTIKAAADEVLAKMLAKGVCNISKTGNGDQSLATDTYYSHVDETYTRR